MKSTQYLKIGEFAKLAGVNKKTLQYYDEIGLLSPVYIAENGYRYYSVMQLDRLSVIFILKDMGVLLKEIKEYLDSENTELLDSLLQRQEKKIEEVIALLDQRKQMLQYIRKTNQEYEKNLGQGICICGFPEEHFDELDISKKQKTGQGLVINYLTDGFCTGMRMDLKQKQNYYFYKKNETGKGVIEKGNYLCIYTRIEEVRETFEQVEKIMDRISTYAQKNGYFIEESFYIEFNELFPEPEKTNYCCVRVRIIEK